MGMATKAEVLDLIVHMPHNLLEVAVHCEAKPSAALAMLQELAAEGMVTKAPGNPLWYPTDAGIATAGRRERRR